MPPRQSEIRNQKSEIPRFYASGAFGGHHDHRHPDCAVAAGGAGGPRGGPADAVPEQPQANRPGLPEPRKHHRPLSRAAAGAVPGPATPTAAPTGVSRAGGTTTCSPISSSRHCTTWGWGWGLGTAPRRTGEKWPPTRSGSRRPWAWSTVPRGAARSPTPGPAPWREDHQRQHADGGGAKRLRRQRRRQLHRSRNHRAAGPAAYGPSILTDVENPDGSGQDDVHRPDRLRRDRQGGHGHRLLRQLD